MCHLRICIDQSVHTVAPLFGEIEESEFYIRSVRVVPIAWSQRADVYFSLGGGSQADLSFLLNRVNKLPAVRSTDYVTPPV
jgi:hypothetical protein